MTRPIPEYLNNAMLSQRMPEFDFGQPALDLAEALESMRLSLESTENGLALAANQIGIELRAFIIGTKAYINPHITKSMGTQVSVEGCLSFPNQYIRRSRPARIWVRYQDEQGRTKTAEYTGLKARVFCHELDHLDGICYTDNVEFESVDN